jgi:UDP-N-acetylmuramate dehydrogenase
MNFPDIDMRGEIRRNEPLSRHTSFCLGGPADVFACPADRDDLKALLRIVKEQSLNYFILGNGTNLLVRDGGFRGVMICLKRLNSISLEREYRSIGGNFAVVYAEAGALLPKLVGFAAEKGLTGLEFAAGIPGSVGGAVRMNAGTSLGEIGDIISFVTMISPDGASVTRNGEEMEFGYRTSLVQEGHCVLDIRMILRRGDKEKVSVRVEELLTARKKRHPLGSPNAGSVFKNPNEESAGRLIESAGLKGTIIGGAQVSDKHANFIITTGPARTSDVLALMDLVKQTVLDVHGVRLEPEIKIIGED